MPIFTITPLESNPPICVKSQTTVASKVPADLMLAGVSQLTNSGEIPKSATPSDSREPTREAGRPGRKLSSSAINFILDGVMLIAFMVVLIAAAIVQFILPEPASAADTTLWGLTYTGWIKILSGTIAVFAVLVLIHLILHWNWVCGFVTSRLSKALGRRVALTESTRTLWGVALLIVVLTLMGIVIAAAEFCVIRSPGGR
ncbi:MAG: DUF4405 domain-containing protein [Phycisphaerae bacterium]|nr:DUF4405 domain-containing protein [Phycisphaerae bacterium]